MAIVSSFHKYRGESSFTINRLVDVIREQIPIVAPQQTRYRVTEVPTARTIRFYTAKGLIDKPRSRDGANALYGYRHLLQTLAVKCLQAQYLPLAKVRSIVDGADNRGLEALITAKPHGVAGLGSDPRGRCASGAYSWPGGSAGTEQTPPQAADAPPSGLPRGPEEVQGTRESTTEPADLWHRVDVGPGIELHVHSAAMPRTTLERLRGALLREIAALRGWSGDGKH